MESGLNCYRIETLYKMLSITLFSTVILEIFKIRKQIKDEQKRKQKILV